MVISREQETEVRARTNSGVHAEPEFYQDPDADLLFYIDKQLSSGVSEDDIAAQLAAAGWQQETISNSLAQALAGRNQPRISTAERDHLTIYITECFHKGLGPETIRTTLLRVGWDPRVVNECMSEAMTRR